MKMKKLKRVVLKEELVALTGDFKLAIVLNQLIYWSERRVDADQFLKEEQERINKYANTGEEAEKKIETLNEAYAHGWIYKKAEELAEDCMIGLSKSTMTRILKTLVENGWIDERANPKYKWDRTKQFRVNLIKIQQDLNKLGYALEGYSLELLENNMFQNETSRNYCEIPTFQNETSQTQNETSEFQNETAIPEITTEITNKITNISSSSSSTLVDNLLEQCSKRRIDISKNEIETLMNLYEPIIVARAINKMLATSKYIKCPITYLQTILDNNVKPNQTVINKTDKPDKFTNYSQRSYDMDSLERKLLGWDNEDLKG